MAIRITRRITRRDFAAVAGGFLLSTKAVAQTETPLLTRPIPGSGERIPAVGLGTAYVFDENSEATRSKADAVVQALVNNGGRLIDTASTYGDAESVLGEVTATAGLREKIFIATKLSSPDSQELKRSLTRLKTASVDLCSSTTSETSSNLFNASRIGRSKACAVMSASLRHSIATIPWSRRCWNGRNLISSRSTIHSITAGLRQPSCHGRRNSSGVLTALPYGNGRLFRAVHGKELPDWARVFANSWGQFFLKYLLGDPRVTAVIRGPAIPATWRIMPARRAARCPIRINVVEWSNSRKRFDR